MSATVVELSQSQDIDLARAMAEKKKALLHEIHKHIVGQDRVAEELLVTGKVYVRGADLLADSEARLQTS